MLLPDTFRVLSNALGLLLAALGGGASIIEVVEIACPENVQRMWTWLRCCETSAFKKPDSNEVPVMAIGAACLFFASELLLIRFEVTTRQYGLLLDAYEFRQLLMTVCVNTSCMLERAAMT